MTKIYFNHDGGVDDLISLFLLLQMGNIELVGVSIIGTDCYLEPSLGASCKIINRFSNLPIDTAPSYEREVNPFPKDWRMYAFFMDVLLILNEEWIDKRSVTSTFEAYEDIINVSNNGKEKVTLLFTGPLTDLAKAIKYDKAIVNNIEELVWMEGVFLEKGNVEEPRHDGTAEWNTFWDSEAVKTTFDTSIKIEMVALESTNQVPLIPVICQMWANQRQFIGADFLGISYAAVPPLIHLVTNFAYFSWNVLTTAQIGKENLTDSIELKVDVYTKGPSQGRTYESDGGRMVHVVSHVNHDEFFNYTMSLAKRVSHQP